MAKAPTAPAGRLNVILAGEGSAPARVLRLLLAGGHRVVVLTSGEPDRAATSGPDGPARAAGLPVLPAVRVRDPGFAGWIRERRVDVLLSVYSLHRVCDQVLAAPRIGCFNLHPGPLPRYAGLDPVSWAILRGETRHGVTLHWMTPRLDAGPIAWRRRFPIGARESALAVATRCIVEGVALVERLLRAAAAGPDAIPRHPQDLGRREYLGAGPPGDGTISWEQPASRLANLVRACDYSPFRSPWGHPRGELGGRPVTILRAAPGGPTTAAPGTLEPAGGTAVQVACADRWLVVEKVILDGRPRPAAALLPSPPHPRLPPALG